MSKFTEVPAFNCHSDTDSTEVSNDEDRPPRSKRGKGCEWIMDSTFSTIEEAKTVIDDEKCWSLRTKSNPVEGEKIVYYCKLERKKCPAAIYLLLHADDPNKVTLFRTEDGHENHEEKNVKGLSADVKDVIVELMKDGVNKPKAILSSLKRRGVAEPQKSQISTFLSSYRSKEFGGSTISATELEELCEQRKEIPEDPDKSFVVCSHVSAECEGSKPELNIFFSTPRLLQNAIVSENLHCDATYKLNWQGYPVFVVGTTDKNRTLHPLGIAVCYSETTADFEFIFKALKDGVKNVHNFELRPEVLVADAAGAISNAFENVFGQNFIRVTCWFHVEKAIRKKLESFKIERNSRDSILKDIHCLQLSQSNVEFNKAASLFLIKWRTENDHEINSFLKYFDEQWLEHNRFAALGHPSTNNAVEATNGVIKKEYTFRERIPVKQFFGLLEEKILPDWSFERDPKSPNHKIFANEPTPTLPLWTKAYQWASSEIKVLSEKSLDESLYYVASSTYIEIYGQLTNSFLEDYKSKKNMWSSFNEFRFQRESVWIMKLTGSNWKSIMCNCPVYLKQYLCKHNLGFAIRLGFTKAPIPAMSIPFGQKRKRGRPQKAKSALIRQ